MSSTLTVRSAGADDYPALAEFHNSQAAFQVEAERMLRADRRSAANDPHFRRVLAETADEVVGSASIRGNWAGVVQPGRFWVSVVVDPRWRGRRIGSRMLDQLRAATSADIHELGACMREDFVAAAEYLGEYGFEERFRSWGAQLDLAAFDPAPFEDAITRLEREGFRFVPYDRLQSAENDARLLELKREIDRDVLSFEPIVPADSEDILGESYLRSGLIVALSEAGEFVGLASLRRDSPDGGIGCGLTGVRRDHRGRGLATALKVRSLQVAERLGATEVGTGGGGADSPMRRLNEKLGFVTEPSWVTFISPQAQSRLTNEAPSGAAFSL